MPGKRLCTPIISQWEISYQTSIDRLLVWHSHLHLYVVQFVAIFNPLVAFHNYEILLVGWHKKEVSERTFLWNRSIIDVHLLRWSVGCSECFVNSQVQVITLSFAVNCPGEAFHYSALKGLPISRGVETFEVIKYCHLCTLSRKICIFDIFSF